MKYLFLAMGLFTATTAGSATLGGLLRSSCLAGVATIGEKARKQALRKRLRYQRKRLRT